MRSFLSYLLAVAVITLLAMASIAFYGFFTNSHMSDDFMNTTRILLFTTLAVAVLRLFFRKK